MNRTGNKLTSSDVVLIRQELKKIAELEASIPLRKMEVAKRFGVSQSTIQKIKTGKYWAWIED